MIKDKKILYIFLLVAVFWIFPTIALSQQNFQQAMQTLTSVISQILYLVWFFFVAFAIIMLMLAGGLFLSAQGNPEDIKKAQKAFIWGIVGVVIAILAFSIMNILQGLLLAGGGGGAGNP